MLIFANYQDQGGFSNGIWSDSDVKYSFLEFFVCLPVLGMIIKFLFIVSLRKCRIKCWLVHFFSISSVYSPWHCTVVTEQPRRSRLSTAADDRRAAALERKLAEVSLCCLLGSAEVHVVAVGFTVVALPLSCVVVEAHQNKVLIMYSSLF